MARIGQPHVSHLLIRRSQELAMLLLAFAYMGIEVR